MNKIYVVVRRVAVMVALVGMFWITNLSTATAVPADPSYSPGAPDHPVAKQTTEYQGNVTSTSGQPENKGLTRAVEKAVNRNDSDRPKTTGEWNREARQTEGQPGKRLERIAKESKEAVQDFGEMYPDTAKRSGRALKEQ